MHDCDHTNDAGVRCHGKLAAMLLSVAVHEMCELQFQIIALKEPYAPCIQASPEIDLERKYLKT